jgi:hypothetical protein
VAALTAQLLAAGLQPVAGPAAVAANAAASAGCSHLRACESSDLRDWSTCRYNGVLTREYAVQLVEEYGAAWMAQDAERITRIFTHDARYLEHPYDPRRIYVGRDGIRDYW